MFMNLNPLLFFLSFAFGLLIVYLTTPSPNVVMKFPTPKNAGKIVYKDTFNNACYIYKADKQEKCENAQKQPIY